MTISVRWENVDLKSQGLSRSELRDVVAQLKKRQQTESDPMSLVRIAKAIKTANKMINARRERTKGPPITVSYSSDPESPTRFSGGQGRAAFYAGGLPGRKR
ncbi:hypothetical protein I6F26_03525 [Ensifer sp. IC3342]|nr:hypothetical protein [Ensifer sp. BRP08]MCA1445663.1 hypothetical protein [Ensifer sp. IC3342]